MSKAEEKAQTAYPTWRNGIGDEFSSNSAYYGFIEGYHQAEKDLELGIVDIMVILDIAIKILRKYNDQKELIFEKYPEGKSYYEEILKRYKERKEEYHWSH